MQQRRIAGLKDTRTLPTDSDYTLGGKLKT